MALKIIKSNAANAYRGYRPYFYGAYKEGTIVTTFKLPVRICGEPPASGYIGDRGDETFEASRKRAEEKFAAIRARGKDKGDAIQEEKTIARMKSGRKFKDPALADLADIYLKAIGERETAERENLDATPAKNLGNIAKRNFMGRSTCHLGMIRRGFELFKNYAAHPDDPEAKKARTLLEVTPELATAFFRHIADDFAFSTVKKWSNLLAGAFDKLMPKSIQNPFKGARLAAIGRASTRLDMETGEKVKVETVVHHRPIDRAQLRQLYAAAKDDPLLYALTVTAASTGLRISDVCTLKWKDIHLTPKNPFIMVETTAKTGAKIAVPIFDYHPDAPDYEPDLGEFRRVLEAALAEAKDGEKFVFPKAAHKYLETKKDEKTGRVYFPGRTDIYTKGKKLFAKALFADEAELVTPDDGETAEKTVEEVLAIIDAAENWGDQRKKAVGDIYSRRMSGESYADIAKATGYTKTTISTYLSDVEDLAGVKVKARSSKPSVRALLKRTRQKRTAGNRAASLYSWHSLRGSFVVMMKDVGVPLDTIRLLVGHTTTTMTLEYYNPTERQAAETTRRIVTRRNRPQALTNAAGTRTVGAAALPPPPTTDAPRGNLDALREALAALTPQERAQLLKGI